MELLSVSQGHAQPEQTKKGGQVLMRAPCRRPFEHILVAGLHYLLGRLDAVSSFQVPTFHSLPRCTAACLGVLTVGALMIRIV